MSVHFLLNKEGAFGELQGCDKKTRGLIELKKIGEELGNLTHTAGL